MASHASRLPALDPAEETRLAALRSLDLLDSAPEREFDTIVALAGTLLDAPFAAVTLVDRDRVWLKSKLGVPNEEEPRDVSFCTWTVESDETLVIPDAEHDPRLVRRGSVYEGHQIRFYAGTPIHAPNGARIGALCVGDREPRALDEASEERLRSLARLVDALIAARATTREAILIASESARQAEHLQRQERVMQQAERLAMIGSWRLTIAENTLQWSDNTYRIYGMPVGVPVGVERALEFYPPHARATVASALAHTIESGAPMDVEVDFVTAQGASRRVRSLGELECQGGRPTAIVGVFQDVTERFMLEQTLRRSADRDELTGIANRAAFNRALEAAVAHAHRTGDALLLALIDMDGFKLVNDTLGHLAGDDVLKAVGRKLALPWLVGSVAARLGGDEFALIVTDPELVADPDAFATRLEVDLAIPVQGSSGSIPSAGTVGTALLTPDDTIRDLVHRADTALYAAKRRRTGERRNGERRTA